MCSRMDGANVPARLVFIHPLPDWVIVLYFSWIFFQSITALLVSKLSANGFGRRENISLKIVTILEPNVIIIIVLT